MSVEKVPCRFLDFEVTRKKAISPFLNGSVGSLAINDDDGDDAQTLPHQCSTSYIGGLVVNQRWLRLIYP